MALYVLCSMNVHRHICTLLYGVSTHASAGCGHVVPSRLIAAHQWFIGCQSVNLCLCCGVSVCGAMPRGGSPLESLVAICSRDAAEK